VTAWQTTREWVRILLATAVIVLGVGAVLGWPVSHGPEGIGRCGQTSGTDSLLGMDDSRRASYVLRRGPGETWDLMEYVRQDEGDVSAFGRKQTACWRLPTAATRLLLLYGRWPPL
jgi:hypothetical protein